MAEGAYSGSSCSLFSKFNARDGGNSMVKSYNGIVGTSARLAISHTSLFSKPNIDDHVNTTTTTTNTVDKDDAGREYD